MTTEITKEQKQEANLLITAQLDIARAALAEAERIAKEFVVDFSFDIGDGSGYFETYKYGDSVEAYWTGWQGSNC